MTPKRTSPGKSSTIHVLCLLCLLICVSASAQQHKLLARDGRAGDQFGYSVAIDGNTALVGAHQSGNQKFEDAGAAYVFSKTANGWQQQTKLVASPAHSGDTLGGNVALHNNMALLGAIRNDDRGKDAGAVFSYERNDNQWSQKQILTAPDAKAGDAFGQSIALTDTFLVIGAPHRDTAEQDAGSVYIFARENHAWRFHSKLIASDGASGDLFGISVAIDGDTVLVGADLNDEKAENAGAVYAFVFDGKRWYQQAKMTAEDAGKTDIFGVRVALSGDTALISARRDDIVDIGIDVGSAYVFERDGTTWQQSAKLLAPDAKADDRFARGVALDGNTAILSAMHHDANGQDSGALYVFKKRQNLWQFDSKVVAADGNPEDRFGWNVALANKTAIVATPHRDDNGESSGAAYIHYLQN